MKGFENLKVTTVHTTGGSTLHCHHSDPASHSDRPVLILVHGWPQSKFMFRHVLPRLTEDYRVLVPDLPGYGESTPATRNDKHSVGIAILEATRAIYGKTAIAFVCHDRGARVAQRLASHWSEVSEQFPDFELKGACLLDIVPIKEQWAAFADPRVAAANFHWPFLAWPSISTPMIKAYGGGRWAKDIIAKTRGTNEAGRALLASDGAIEQYAAYFDRDSNIDAAAADYLAGGTEDWDAQVADLKSDDQRGLMGVPTLVVYSARDLGSRSRDMESVWRPWIQEKTPFECVGLGDNVGHYLPEEAPEALLKVVLPWLEKL